MQKNIIINPRRILQLFLLFLKEESLNQVPTICNKYQVPYYLSVHLFDLLPGPGVVITGMFRLCSDQNNIGQWAYFTVYNGPFTPAIFKA